MKAPSRLPGWSRAPVATHIARNADAMVNVCTWAKTAIETPMYESKGERDSQIEGEIGCGVEEIVADVAQSANLLTAPSNLSTRKR